MKNAQCQNKTVMLTTQPKNNNNKKKLLKKKLKQQNNWQKHAKNTPAKKKHTHTHSHQTKRNIQIIKTWVLFCVLFASKKKNKLAKLYY